MEERSGNETLQKVHFFFQINKKKTNKIQKQKVVKSFSFRISFDEDIDPL